MTNKDIYKNLNGLDPVIIDKADPTNDRHTKKSVKKNRIIPITAATLCAAVLILAILLPKSSVIPPMNTSTPSATGEKAHLSAEDVADIFGVSEALGGTKAYTKLYLPEDKKLNIVPLPTDEYIAVYKKNINGELSEAELNEFADRISPMLASVLGRPMSAFEKGKLESNESQKRIYMTYEAEDGLSLVFDHYPTYNGVWIYKFYNQPLSFNGKTVQIDQRQSEAEILESLEWLKNILFNSFNCNFERAKVNFYYNAYSKHGVSSIDVIYYNETESPLAYDQLRIHFDNIDNGGGSPRPSKDILKECDIYYEEYRAPIEETYSVESVYELISLETAEEHLRNGYVFSGHVCPLCMELQDEVDFSEYDHVSFEYVADRYTDDGRVIPFYTFYKIIGTASNGNTIYAKTYVCAVEVEGLKEYFELQEKNHNGLITIG